MIEEVRSADKDASTVPFLDGERTPAGLIRLACALHASAASLAEIRDMLGWFGVDRSRPAIRNWCQSFAESHEQAFTAEPDRVAVDEKQVGSPKNAKSGCTRRSISIRKSCSTHDFLNVVEPTQRRRFSAN